jgi:MFS family permease
MQPADTTRENCSCYHKILPFIVCFSASLFFFYEFIQGNMFSSIADNLMHDFGIDANQMTYLSSIYYFSNVLFLFVAGYILDHYSPKKTLLFAMLLCVASTFVFAVTHNFWVALLCRFVTGIGSAFCFLGPIRVASRWFPVNRMAMITGIVVTFAMTGGILSQYPLTKLVDFVGWREAVNNIAWFGVFLWILMLFGIKESQQNAGLKKNPSKSTQSIFYILKTIYFNAQIIRAAMFTSLMNMAVAVFGAMMGTLYLVERLGVSKTDASKINSMLFLGAIVGGPLIGWISDRFAKRVLPMKIAAVISLWLMLSIMYLPLSPVSMGVIFFFLGLITAAQVISYAFVAENSSPQITAMAVSAISVLTQGGYVIYQNIFSYILTHCGQVNFKAGIPTYGLESYQIAAIILPLGLALAYFMALKLKETHARQVH